MFDFGNTHSKFENGMAEFFGISQLPLPPRPNILFEIISARNVVQMPTSSEERKEEEAHGYHCIVKIGSKTIHRTEVDNRQKKTATVDAIWTIQTGSLGLAHVPEDEEEELQEQQNRDDEERENNNSGEENPNSVIIEVKQGTKIIGIVTIPFQEVLPKRGKREEYSIIQQQQESSRNDNEEIQKNLGILALRFRRATEKDVAFLQHEKLTGKDERKLKDLSNIPQCE